MGNKIKERREAKEERPSEKSFIALCFHKNSRVVEKIRCVRCPAAKRNPVDAS